MRHIELGAFGYALNNYFIRNGLLKTPTGQIKALVRLAERVSGTTCGADRVQFLRDFAESQGIRPYQLATKQYSRRYGRHVDPFFLRPEWKALRYRVIRDNNGQCQACGATAQTSGKPMHVDHIVPRSVDRSKELEYSNLQLLCEACNIGKGNTDSIDWRKRGTGAD